MSGFLHSMAVTKINKLHHILIGMLLASCSERKTGETAASEDALVAKKEPSSPESGKDPFSQAKYDRSLSEVREALKAQTALNAFREACRKLAQSLSLPDGSFDVSGKTLPQEFISYLKDENAGYDKFVAELSPDGKTAFNTMRQTSRFVGVIELVDCAVKISETEKPSVFDFIMYSNISGEVREYPTYINDAARAQASQSWNLLSESANPVFRLLAVNEAKRVIQAKPSVLALLDARTGEVDPVIVQALIDQLVRIGGDAAKGSLKRISDNALARHDQTASKTAEDAIAKMK